MRRVLFLVPFCGEDEAKRGQVTYPTSHSLTSKPRSQPGAAPAPRCLSLLYVARLWTIEQTEGAKGGENAKKKGRPISQGNCLPLMCLGLVTEVSTRSLTQACPLGVATSHFLCRFPFASPGTSSLVTSSSCIAIPDLWRQWI